MTAFARAHGRPPGLVVAGSMLGAGGLMLAGARASGVSGQRWGLVAVVVAAGGAGASLIGWYLIAARSLAGRRLAYVGAITGIAGVLLAVVGGAAADGALRFDRLGRFVEGAVLADAFPVLLRGVWNTLRLAVAAEVLALAIGLFVATLSIARRRSARWASIVYVDAVRGMPIVVLTFLIYAGLPEVGIRFSPFVGAMVILGLNAGAYLAEIFRAGIQSVPRGQTEAARSLGMPHAQTMTSIVIPQAARSVLPPLVSEFIALLKDTAIVMALVGTTISSVDIFNAARGEAASTFSPAPYVLAAIFYLAITIPLARVVGVLEKRARAGYV